MSSQVCEVTRHQVIVKLTWLIIAGLTVGSSNLRAQLGEPPDSVGEVSAYSGVAFGQFGTHPVVGGTTGLTMYKYALAMIDTNFMPLNTNTLLYYPQTTKQSLFFDFNFAVHVQVPVNHHWAPYALFGAGIFYNTYRIQTLRQPGVVVFVGQDDVRFGFQTGGGVRYRVNESWGIKGEYRYAVSNRDFNRVLGGVFYQFSGTWPFLSRGKRRTGGVVN